MLVEPKLDRNYFKFVETGLCLSINKGTECLTCHQDYDPPYPHCHTQKSFPHLWWECWGMPHLDAELFPFVAAALPLSPWSLDSWLLYPRRSSEPSAAQSPAPALALAVSWCPAPPQSLRASDSLHCFPISLESVDETNY